MKAQRPWILLALVGVALLAAAAMQVDWVYRSFRTEVKLSDMALARAVDATIADINRTGIRREIRNDSLLGGGFIQDSIIEEQKWVQSDGGVFRVKNKVTRRKEVWKKDSTIEREDIRLLVDKVVEEIHQAPQPLEARLHKDTFLRLFQRNLQQAGIRFAVEYGLYNSAGKLSYSSSSFDSANARNAEGRNVFRQDILWDPVVLKVQTPNRAWALWKEMAGSILLSVFVLVLVAVGVFFIYRNYRELRRNVQMKTELISNISHELKTPVATLDLCIQSLYLQEAASPHVRRLGGIMTEETGRIKKHIDRILDLAMLEKESEMLQPEKFVLRDFLNSVVQGMDPLLQEAGATVQLLVEEDISLILDPFHFENVCRNILDNCMKYAKPGVPLHILIEARTDKAEVRIAISDNGKGVAGNELQKIFEPFYRADRSNVHNVKGSGIGLAYCKAVVENSGGKLYAEHVEPHGLKLVMDLPLAKNA